MADVKPLALKSERVKRAPAPSTGSNSIAQLWIDSGVYHLDQTFDYAIPQSLQGRVHVGQRVQVPFNGRSVEGLVVGLANTSQESRLKSLDKTLGDLPVATTLTIELIEKVASHWAAHPMDIVRSAIPPRVAKAEKSIHQREVQIRDRETREADAQYLQLPPHKNRYQLLAKLIQGQLTHGSVLVIVPEVRDVKHLGNQLAVLGIDSTSLDAELERSERYSNFLSVMQDAVHCVIGTRSAVFAPVHNLGSIVILNELAESMYEVRTPGWNVRDVASMRREIEHIGLTFVGYSPSLEIASKIDSGSLIFKASPARLNIKAISSPMGELLPGKSISMIRKALSLGPVLFIAPQKGYAQAISCRKCRNISLCECGGKLVQRSARAAISCSHCDRTYPEWRCTWCQGQIPSLQSRGSARFAYEIGLAFPKFPISESTGERLIDLHQAREGIVIATPGAVPYQPGGYAAVILLNADYFVGQSDIRAIERVREMIFASASLLTESAPFIYVGEDISGVCTALTNWKPQVAINKELRERSEVHLPPAYRAAVIDISTDEASTVFRALQQAQQNGLFPNSVMLSGPIPLRDDISRILLRCEVRDGDSMIHTLHEFQRRRSLSKKRLPSLRVDPYSLSR